MIRITLAATGACALFTAALSAQTAPAPAAPARTETAQNLTMTGCLKPWDASTMGAPPAAGRAPSGAAATPQYVLTDASNGSAAPPPPAGTVTGTPTAPAVSGAALGAHSTYLLKTQTPAVDLASHVDHQVEVTGILSVESAKEAAATPGTAGPKPATAATEGGSKSTFTVTALKMIAKTCS